MDGHGHQKKKQHYTQQVDFAQLKSELQLTEKHDLTMIKAENDRLFTDIEKLRQRLREEVSRTQAGVRLDLNLEKGRIREEASRQELKMKEVDTRIEQEIAGLRAAIQSSKVGDYLVRLGELIHDLGVRRRRSSTWLGLVSCVFGSVKCDQLTDCLCSDWLHGASHGIPTFPGVIGSFFQVSDSRGHPVGPCFLYSHQRISHCIIIVPLEVIVSLLE
jgi:hypothetical protein